MPPEPMTVQPEAEPRPPYLWALLVGVAVLVLYVATLAPTTAFWDTSEYIAAAKVLGIPHPPGNPLFTLMAHVFGLLPLAATYAVRINLFAAVTSAASAALWFLVAERWMREIVPVAWARIAAAAAGVLVSAASWTVWNQSTVNEKVYTVSLLSIALVTWLAVHWGDDDPGPHRDRWLILIAYIIALSSTNHQMGVLATPAVAVYVLWTDWRVITRPAVIVGVVTAAIVGISINYIYLPMRAGQFPPINEGEPVGFFSQALSDVLNRVQYQKPPITQRQADLPAQVMNYLQYFSWQFARDWDALRAPMATLFGAIGLTGLWQLLARDRRAGLAALAMFGTLTAALVFYLNFKYGYSMYPGEPDLPREVRERDYFFIGSFGYFGVLVALGFGVMLAAMAEGLRRVVAPERRRWLFAAPVLLLGVIPLLGNRVTASRAGEYMARDVALDLLESVQPYGILITAGDNDTFPLWFAQEVLGVRRDVTLANLSLMNTRWHLRQLRRRPTPEFEPERAAPIWRTPPAGLDAWPRPTTPVFRMTEDELDSLPEVVPVQRNSGVRLDSLRLLFGNDYLALQDLATISLIRDNLGGERTIYFSWSDGTYPDQTFNLTPYLITQGLARKLMPRPVVPNDSIVVSQGLGFLDLPTTRRLMWDVYHWETAMQERPRGWVDDPSGSILSLYSVVYGATASTLRQVGDTASAERAEAVVLGVRRNLEKR